MEETTESTVFTIFSMLACSTTKHPDPDATVVLDEETTLEQSELNGTLVTETVPAPEFTALNQEGIERTRADFMGRPTVIWFYPAANTPG